MQHRRRCPGHAPCAISILLPVHRRRTQSLRLAPELERVVELWKDQRLAAAARKGTVDGHHVLPLQAGWQSLLRYGAPWCRGLRIGDPRSPGACGHTRCSDPVWGRSGRGASCRWW